MIEIEYQLTVKQEEQEENSLHWHALNYRTASTQNAHEMFLALENYVLEREQRIKENYFGVHRN
jgi:hypothetical protein